MSGVEPTAIFFPHSGRFHDATRSAGGTRSGTLDNALCGGKLATIQRVVLPMVFTGIGASVILDVSCAVGETMIVAIAAGQSRGRMHGFLPERTD
jgi:ABC-type phosphate transport system permease subunit